MATGLTDPKMQDAEGTTEDSSGKKRLKFKSLKKLFVKKKKKELVTQSKSSLKQSQSTSDVTGPELRAPDPDSEDEQSAHRNVMGTRALSHDSIFIPDTSGQPAVQPARVFSQESISAPIRALQLKVQQNIKLGPPPKSTPAKRIEDTGASSEDDGLPRSPPESSPIHEALARSQLAKYSDHYKNHSSLTLGGTGSEEEEQISPGSYSRPNSPHSAVVTTRPTARSRSPTSPLVYTSSTDSHASPGIDFNSPPVLSLCLDNSAARHRLAVKPRNQRSHTKRRSSSRLLAEGLSDSMYNVPELKEENEQETVKNNAEFANPEMDLEQRAECPTTILPQGQQTEPSIIMPEAVNAIEQGADELPIVDVAGQQATDALDGNAQLQTYSVSSEIAEYIMPVELDVLGESVTDISVLPGTSQVGSTVVISDDSTSLDVIDPLKQEKSANLWEAAAVNTDTVPVDTSLGDETACPTQNLIRTDILLIDSDKPSAAVPEGSVSREGEYLQEDPCAYCKQAKMEPTSEGTFACSDNAEEHSIFKDTVDKVPENFSSIPLTQLSDTYSQPADSPKTSKEPSVLETVGGGSLENKDIAVFKEANIKISEEKTLSQQGSFKKNSQSSFKFSISSAWNRSRHSGVKQNDDPAADPDVSYKTIPQEASLLPGNENKEKDEGMSLPESSASKIEAHGQEKTEEDEEGRGAFGVRLRSTSYCLKYKEVSHTEHKETGKRHSAEIPLDSSGCPSQPTADMTEVKKPQEGLIDDGKLKAKSSENLAARPPLPRKPVLQNLNTPTTAMDIPKTVKSTQERLKDTEKRTSVGKNSENCVEVLQDGYCEEDKGQPFNKDNGSSVEDSTVPAWVTMARQKQKGYQEQYIGKEAKMPAKEVKADTEKQQESDKDATNAPIESKSTHPKSSTINKPTQDYRLEIKASVSEPQKKTSPKTSPVTVSKHSSAMTQNTSDKDGRDQHSKDKVSPSSNQPSWMELAKKKAKAWSDMPQIIK
ncbi:CRACD-like protein isoform X1 [Hypanus sabinus]|uniref:CRACD-like protein isoform X1 n=1 Tax=Hypanus sabinus TaxID=79690 RepID=UPI0028C4EEFD|nr:CRACD-like protein isoform X1 [Hypanus sabinus]XP_059819895.1 CRACD-like protein isoform X1 [Hypanus sabinus]XP_059819896.1 CRACD-like protein isoform X1 [Hypanus sabinus]XP_059819897.1 CRACD-like protein isoform X1 [Hypanus sabinus]XP_059819898.1 CRACD-like protein isoform X1 [Hypanus sabinus]XP_059819899.1 CRACD-like protein isoform X1 [Hypanus sabinus]XP_059819900.1 CRACD-like protein isoform X1 [Hypanus sabinus]